MPHGKGCVDDQMIVMAMTIMGYRAGGDASMVKGGGGGELVVQPWRQRQQHGIVMKVVMMTEAK